MAQHTDDRDAGEELVLSLAAAWAAVEQRINRQLASIRGISLAEYRLLRTLSTAPNARSSRADLARSIGLTPSAVTRALRPLEQLGMVATVKNERDARLALATLTPAGTELVSDASDVVRDATAGVFERTPRVVDQLATLTTLLNELAAT